MRKAHDRRTEATLPERLGIGHGRQHSGARAGLPVRGQAQGGPFHLLALVLSFIVAACQSAPPIGSSAPSSAASPGAAATPAGSKGGVASASDGTAATPIPELLALTLDDAGPIVTPEDGPDWARYSLPAAATRALDGTYVMVIVWFGESDDNPPLVTVATSTDTRAWHARPNPILGHLGVGSSRPGPIPAALVQVDGGWQMYGWAAEATQPDYWRSWRASAPDLDGPWTLDQGRILVPGRPGTWDSQTAAIGAVQPTDEGFLAWYEGQPPGSSLRGDLGVATSTDGLSWRKYNDPATTAASLAESDPVIARGICGAGTELAVFQPQVEVAQGGSYIGVFGGFGSSREHMDVFGGVSADGLHWTCGTPEPLIRFGGIPNSQGIHTIASFPLGDGRIGLVLESLGEGRSDLWLATVRLLD